MSAFKTHFPIKAVRTDVIATQVEQNTFAIELESTDAFEKDRDPKHETVSSMREPGLIIQKTKTQGWVILNEGNFDLDQNDLQELGKAIERDYEGLL